MSDIIKIMDEAYRKNKIAIELLLNEYDRKKEILERVGENIFLLLSKCESLKPYRHSVKYRIKDKGHFKDKLIRRVVDLEKEGLAFDVIPENLFDKIHDLVGVRVLHIHTDQITNILAAIKDTIGQENYKIVEEPTANIWDVEYKDFYESRGIKVIERKKMYTSIHFIISSYNKDNTPIEVQIRTLAEELWGEVSHTVNYPHESTIKLLQDQLGILARITSAGTRLVDTIFKIHEKAP